MHTQFLSTQNTLACWLLLVCCAEIKYKPELFLVSYFLNTKRPGFPFKNLIFLKVYLCVEKPGFPFKSLLFLKVYLCVGDSNSADMCVSFFSAYLSQITWSLTNSSFPRQAYTVNKNSSAKTRQSFSLRRDTFSFLHI